MLNKVEGPALSKIPSEVKREQNFEDIERHLKRYYQSSIYATVAVMKAHAAAGIIPDPHLVPTAALTTLRAHAEVFENTDRFLQLTSEVNTRAMLTTGANVQMLLQLLPSRVRDIDNLSVVETDNSLRDLQY